MVDKLSSISEKEYPSSESTVNVITGGDDMPDDRGGIGKRHLYKSQLNVSSSPYKSKASSNTAVSKNMARSNLQRSDLKKQQQLTPYDNLLAHDQFHRSQLVLNNEEPVVEEANKTKQLSVSEQVPEIHEITNNNGKDISEPSFADFEDYDGTNSDEKFKPISSKVPGSDLHIVNDEEEIVLEDKLLDQLFQSRQRWMSIEDEKRKDQLRLSQDYEITESERLQALLNLHVD